MSSGPDLSSLTHAQKDALIGALMAQVATLTARLSELEAKLGLPPKTPNNSSVPPSKGQKASESSKPKDKAKPHAGAHRPLHPNPTSKRVVLACLCGGCGADVSSAPQSPSETYDRVEIPEIKPDVTQVTLFGGVCPGCARRFKAEAPEGLEPGSPPELVEGRAESACLRDLSALAPGHSAGAVERRAARSAGARHQRRRAGQHSRRQRKIVQDADEPHQETNLIKARLLSGTALASDETGMRVGKANWWLWVFHHRDSAVFVAGKHRSKGVVETFLGDWRPDYWISDRYGGQMGWARREHQVCLAHYADLRIMPTSGGNRAWGAAIAAVGSA